MSSALPADMDYDALCAAVAATERGRWFLSEYARRNRNSDTAQVLAAITRMESMVTAARSQRAAQDADQQIHIELLEIARTIAQTRADVAETRPELPPSAEPTHAPADVATAAERLRQIAWTLRACGIDLPISEQIAQVAEAILSAQALRGISEQRTQKITEALHYLEHRIDRILDSRHIFARAAETPQSNRYANDPASGHSNGHGHDAASTAIARTDIDRNNAPQSDFSATSAFHEAVAHDADSATIDADESAAVKAAAEEAAAVVAAAEEAAEAQAAADEAAAVVAAAAEAAAVVPAAGKEAAATVATAEEATEAQADAEEAAAVRAAVEEAAAVVAAAKAAAATENSDDEIAAQAAAAEETDSSAVASQTETVAQPTVAEPTLLESAHDTPTDETSKEHAPAQVSAEAPMVAQDVAVEAVAAESPVAEATASSEASEPTPEDRAVPPATPDEPEPPPTSAAELPKPIRLVSPTLDLDPPPVGRRPLAAQAGAAPAQYEAHQIQFERVEIEIVPLIAASAGGARAAPAMMQRVMTDFVGLELSPPAVRQAIVVKPPAEPHTAEALSTKPAANQNLAARDVGTTELRAPNEATIEAPGEAASEAPSAAASPADQTPTTAEAPGPLEPASSVPDAVATSREPAPTRAAEAPTLHSRLPAATTADAIARQVERDLNALTDIAARAGIATDFLVLAPPISAGGAHTAPPSPKATKLSNALAAIETELYAGAALASSTPPPPTATVKPTSSSAMTGPLAALMAMSDEEKIALFS